MADIVETREWSPGIYQFETSDPVQGGPDGIDNVQAKQLAARTNYLKDAVESSLKEIDDHESSENPHSQYLDKRKGGDIGGPLSVAGVLKGTSGIGALRATNGGGEGSSSLFLSRDGADARFKTWELVHGGDGAVSLRLVSEEF